jgi:hypothetical protein
MKAGIIFTTYGFRPACSNKPKKDILKNTYSQWWTPQLRLYLPVKKRGKAGYIKIMQIQGMTFIVASEKGIDAERERRNSNELFTDSIIRCW